MSSSATINVPADGVGPSLPFSSRPREISGLAASRKPVSSVGIEGQDWLHPSVRLSFRAAILQTLQQAVLPQASVRGQRLWLAEEVLADFAVILCAAGVISKLPELALGSTFLVPQFVWFGHSVFQLALLYGTLFTLLGYSERLYQLATVESSRSARMVLGKCVVWSALLACVLSGHVDHAALAWHTAFVPLSYLFLLARRAIRRHFSASHGEARDVKNVLIVGTGNVACKLADHLEHSPLEKRSVVGFLDDHAVVGGKVRGRIRDLESVAQTQFVDEVILAGVKREVALKAIWEARRCGLDIKVVPDFYGMDPRPSMLAQVGDVPIMTLRQKQLPVLGFALKRVVDILGAGVGLILSLPLMAIIALVIRLDSPGPILYKAPRAGFKGRRFACYKFRTMVADADEKKRDLLQCNERTGAFFKIHDDPRITRVGRFLRRYSLDELPQLWNVFRGEMSLVGPRPHPLDDFSRYRPQDLKRLEAIPGLTGLWQVTARQDASFDRNVALDREYIEHWSLGADFRILMKTVSVVMQGNGS